MTASKSENFAPNFKLTLSKICDFFRDPRSGLNSRNGNENADDVDKKKLPINASANPGLTQNALRVSCPDKKRTREGKISDKIPK
jgi:hypothetical protein